MLLLVVAIRNVARNMTRTALTVLGVAVAIMTFVMLRTVIWSWTAGVEQSAPDHVWIRNKATFVLPLPKKYASEVREVPGITSVVYANWFGAKDPTREHQAFASVAIQGEDMFKVFDEFDVPADQKQAWLKNRSGALIGDVLAKKMGWNVGDKVTLRGTVYPGNWEFEISGIYHVKSSSVDRSTFYLHWAYLNESMPPARQDQIGWITARTAGLGDAAAACRAIDARFDTRDTQTLCMNERAMRASSLGMMSAALRVIDLVSVVNTLIMMLILANTLAMSVRERTREYGTLRAIGFLPRHILFFVVAEALAIGALGGGLGLLLSYPLIQDGLGRFVEENIGSLFPSFQIQPTLGALALILALGMSAIAAVLPVLRALRLKTVDALRQVG